MNRLSVVLAADSAATVQYWNNQSQKYEERYFKGANKIFQLSETHPVGVMVYDAADLLGVPWELVIKEFRRFLSERSFPSVQGYVAELVGFINENMKLFPNTVREDEFFRNINQAIYQSMFELKMAIEDQTIVAKPNFVDIATNLSDSDHAADARIEGLLKHSDRIEKTISEIAQELELDVEKPFDSVLRSIIAKALDNIKRDSPQTGIVLAGFGDHSVFPELVKLSACRFWADEFIVGSVETEATGYDQPAYISGFAQTSMTDTFHLGISDDIWMAMARGVGEAMRNLAIEIQQTLGQTLTDPDLGAILGRASESIRASVLGHARDNHAVPLRRVVGALPVDEMGHLAETLINLQSLKEKVTRPSESVGGPVDVAAITKSEGLVWLKRKHYFSADINARFFERRHKT
ncbi:hypothetical protein [Neogemmobacter tilapiae]|nr:hypothetical protein [Gemmobacter tilapiae]